MASVKYLVAIALIAALVAPALATDFIVGDSNGWANNNFDYKTWAAGKEFHVGDRLVFKYKAGAHNVHKVDLASFQNCTVPENSVALNTGNDAITLASGGKKWYICGVAGHCATGNQKLAITVLAQAGAPAPSTSAASGLFASSAYLAWIAAAAAAFGTLIMMVMV